MTIVFEYINHPQRMAAAWQSFVQAVPQSLQDAYAMPAYLQLNRWVEQGEPGVIFYQGDAGTLWYPFVLRDIPAVYQLPGKDIISPYGFGGLFLHGANDQSKQLLASAFEGFWQRFCQEHDVVAEFIRFHPLLENHKFCHFASVHSVKDVVWFDLTLSEDVLTDHLHPQKRREIRKVSEFNLQWSDDWQYYDDFKRLYVRSMTEKQASAFYFFSDAFFDNLLKQFPQAHVRLHSVLHEGNVMSSALFLIGGETVHYFLGANDPAAKSLHSSAWLLWNTALFAKSQGYRRYILGGGVQKDDSLFRFKRQLSPLTMPYAIGTCVRNPERYEAIKAIWKTIRPQPPQTDSVRPAPEKPDFEENLPLLFYRQV